MNAKDFRRTDISDLSDCNDKLNTSLTCKIIHIGNYRFEVQEPVVFTSKGIKIVAPLFNNPKEYCTLNIYKDEVVKIISHFGKTALICFYTLRKCAQYIKTSLNMEETGSVTDGATYFSANGPYQYRKILLIIDSITEQSRSVLKSIWSFFDEIGETDAQELLQRAALSSRQPTNKLKEENKTTTQLFPGDVRNLLIYPPGKGGININTEDYLCLATDQYLNDIIIDFYLKWVQNNLIPIEKRENTFIFSTFFYKRLTTLVRGQQGDKDVRQTAAQKRHARVQNWTKNVNLFEKDFIIIPINEQSHWFLAIICFPNLKGPVTFDTNIPVEPQQIKKQRGKKISLQIGSTTITPLSKRDSNPNILAEVVGVGDDHDSDRDEAEGDESDLASEDSDFDNGVNNTVPPNTNQTPTSSTVVNTAEKQPIKQPLILIFDSLAGPSRSRVVATLRDYLSCEYKLKMPDAVPHVFNKDNMPGHCVKVPQQNNFTDCGLFLLQYVESFFKAPITDYRLPIKQLNNWFDILTVTRKREDISNLLQQLLNEKHGSEQLLLPDIPFPTLNGDLIETHEEYNVDFEEDGMEDEPIEEEDEGTSGADGDLELGSDELSQSPIKTTTAALVPTHGRQIVVKRRMQIVHTNNELTPQHGNLRNSLVKIRKIEQ